MTRPALLAWCAAASLGLLFVKVNTLLSYAATGYKVPGASGLTPGIDAYVPFVAVAAALVAWHLAPRRSWAWLLLAGAVLALPDVVVRLAPDLYLAWLAKPLAIMTACAPAATIVGILGGATLLWQAGRRALGAALTGTALVIQLLGPVVLGSTLDASTFVFGNIATWTAGLVLALIAAAGAVVALVARRGEAEPVAAARPGWRVTAAGGVAAAVPVLAVLWQLDPAAPSDYFLYIGLAFLAIGLVLGAAAGPRVLLASATSGLLLGTFGMLITPSVEVLRDIPALTVVAAAGSVLLGFAAALHPWRGRFAAGGLLTVAAGLIVLFGLFNSDEPFASYEDFSFVLTPILLVIGIVAAVAGIGSIGSTLADHAESPAVFAGTATPFSLGAIGIIAHFTVHAPAGKAPLAGLLPPAAGGLLLAAVTLVVLTRTVLAAES